VKLAPRFQNFDIIDRVLFFPERKREREREREKERKKRVPKFQKLVQKILLNIKSTDPKD